MGLFKSKEEKATAKAEKELKKESKACFTGTAMQQIGKIQKGLLVDLRLDPAERKLHIVQNKNNIDITIPYERLCGFIIENETKLAQSGSTVARAAVGGLLFGKTGAVVGGMSGKGNTKTTWYATLTYEGKTGETQELIFKDFVSKENVVITHSDFSIRVRRIISENLEDVTEL